LTFNTSPEGSTYLLIMNLFILIIVILCFIYNLSGLYQLFPLLILIINIILSTIFMSFNPDSYLLRTVRLLSLFLIIIIIFNHIKLLLFQIF